MCNIIPRNFRKLIKNMFTYCSIANFIISLKHVETRSIIQWMDIFLLPYCCCIPSGNVPFPVGFQVSISEGLMSCTRKPLLNGGQMHPCSTVLTAVASIALTQVSVCKWTLQLPMSGHPNVWLYEKLHKLSVFSRNSTVVPLKTVKLKLFW